jgi:hypothetical protein
MNLYSKSWTKNSVFCFFLAIFIDKNKIIFL